VGDGYQRISRIRKKEGNSIDPLVNRIKSGKEEGEVWE